MTALAFCQMVFCEQMLSRRRVVCWWVCYRWLRKAWLGMLSVVSIWDEVGVVEWQKRTLNGWYNSQSIAYGCYTIVWQEYKRMGQEYTRYMDRDTVSAIQFGIGTVHLLLSSLPPKILKIFSTLGFKSDKQLGFALLKLCLEGKGIRSPLASLM